MTAHKGWSVRANPGSGKWRGMVLRPGTGTYQTKQFATAALARKWARDEAAKVVTGQPSVLSPGQERAWFGPISRAYQESMKARGRSPSHLRNVRKTLALARREVRELNDPRAGLRLERWLDGLDVAPATRNRMLVELRGCFLWALRRDLIAKDPARAIERATEPRSLRPQFSVPEVVALLALPTPDPMWHRRVSLMLLAGLREQEAAAITWAQVDAGARVLRVVKHDGYELKNGREHIVQASPLLLSLLGDPGVPPVAPPFDGSGKPAWAATVRARNAERAQAEGTGPAGRVAPLIDSNARRGFAAYLVACGVAPGGRTNHSCRHTYGAMMTATGVPSLMLGAYMGHGGLSATAVYTRMAPHHVAAVKGWPMGELRVGVDPAAPWGPPSP